MCMPRRWVREYNMINLQGFAGSARSWSVVGVLKSKTMTWRRFQYALLSSSLYRFLRQCEVSERPLDLFVIGLLVVISKRWNATGKQRRWEQALGSLVLHVNLVMAWIFQSCHRLPVNFNRTRTGSCYKSSSAMQPLKTCFRVVIH